MWYHPAVARVTLDTNVVVAALRSDEGASFRLLSLVGSGRFEIALSVALVLEYEDALQRHLPESPFDEDELGALLDYLCSVGHRQEIFYLWRPVLRDPGDDLVLEVAVASRSDFIVTFNQRDFAGSEAFGIRVVTPSSFLEQIGDIP
jgi:putative PIN family toxin of toxin-antitoxin system